MSLIQDYGRRVDVCAKASTQMWRLSLSCSERLTSCQAALWKTDPAGLWRSSARSRCLPAGLASPAAPSPHKQLNSCMVSPSSLFSEHVWEAGRAVPVAWPPEGLSKSLAPLHHYPYFPSQYLHGWKQMNSMKANPSLFIYQTMSVTLLTHL